MSLETKGPTEKDLNRAIELSNLFVDASRKGTPEDPVPINLSRGDFLLLSAALRSFTFLWGDAMRRHQVVDFLSSSPIVKMQLSGTVEILEELRDEHKY